MASKLALGSTLTLPNSSVTIPRLGFGVYRSPAPTCVHSCLTALKTGYRHIDTAQYYGNEEEVGLAVKKSDIPRSDIYLTSKILSPGHDADETYKSIVESVKKMDDRKDGYIDLFLIHNASSSKENTKAMWEALEKAKEEGIVREIGVSNAGKKHIEDIKSYAKVWPPAINQIELHPWCQQREAVAYCHSQGIVVQAYCPLVRNKKADDKDLTSIAEKHGKTTGQVLIRYALQKDWVPLPKSDTPSRIEGNANVYDFELDAEDMKALDDKDEGAKGSLVIAVQN